MTQREAIRILYDIEDDIIINRLNCIKNIVNRSFEKEWPTIFILDLLYDLINNNMETYDLLDSYLSNKRTDNKFRDQLEVLFDIYSDEEIVDTLSSYWNNDIKSTKKGL